MKDHLQSLSTHWYTPRCHESYQLPVSGEFYWISACVVQPTLLDKAPACNQNFQLFKMYDFHSFLVWEHFFSSFCWKSVRQVGGNIASACEVNRSHDDVIKWKHFPRYWPLGGNSPVSGEFPSKRPVRRFFDIFFHMLLNKRLNKQSWGWWFVTPSRSLWRHSNEAQGVARLKWCFENG